MTSIDYRYFGRSLLEIKTFGYLLEKLGGDVLVLDPPFQRNYVWEEKLEKKFISTVYRGGDTDRIILNRKVVDGDIKCLCVDGKQRLTALQKFKENKFKAKIGEGGNRKSLLFREMSDEQRGQFEGAQIPIRVYFDMSEEKQSKLFKVIQNGKSLMNGELVNGTNNESSKFIRKLRKNIPSGFFTQGIEKRMGESDSLCRFVYLCVTANEKVVASPDHQLFHDAKKCSEWVLETSIKKKQRERTLDTFKHLSDFVKNGGDVTEKKAATFVYLSHLVYIYDKELDEQGKCRGRKIIKKLKKRVEKNLAKTTSTNYYLRPFLDSHIKTVKEVLEELGS